MYILYQRILFKIMRILSLLHTQLLRNKATQIGKNSVVFLRSEIRNIKGGVIYIGTNCQIGRTKHGYHGGMPFYTTLFCDSKEGKIKIGNNCRLNGVYVNAIKSVIIGNNCVMASSVHIMDSNGHQTCSFDRTKGMDEAEQIVIGNNVWIGLNAIILKGTTIGDNCIVAAGSIVKGIFDANSIIFSQKTTSKPLFNDNK